jgi:hypothetical protein
LGTVANKTIYAYLKGSTGNISSRMYATVTTSRTDNQVLLGLPTATAASATLILTWDDTDLASTFYVDNISLYPVNVTYNDPDQYILFDYNPSDQIKTLQLNGQYVDGTGKTYSGKVSLAPYSSLVLIATSASTRSKQNPPKAGGTPVVY